MFQEKALLLDSLETVAGFDRPTFEQARIIGHGEAVLRDHAGEIKQVVPFCNLVTRVGDQWYGDRAALVKKASVAITAATNADPSTVTTGSAHGLGPGDVIVIASVAGATGLNGTWAVATVPSTTTFTVDVGAVPGVWSSGGTVVGMTLPTVSGMKLGVDNTAAAKTGAGAALVSYTTASQHALDSLPASSLSGSSRRITFVTTWAAGEATASGLVEVVLTIDHPLANAAGTAADTIARAILSPSVNKGASDTLAITWNHDLLGA